MTETYFEKYKPNRFELNDLTKICKEFDELVELEKSFSHPTLDSFKNLRLADFFGVGKSKRLSNLPLNQYYYVVSAANAIDAYGKGEIGMSIYNKNKANYVFSKETNSLFSTFLNNL